MDDNVVNRDPRIANLDVVHVRDERTGRFEAAHFENISKSGLFIITKNLLPVGSRVRLKFTLVSRPDGASETKLRQVDVQGEVIRSISGREAVKGLTPGMGVKFIDLPEDATNLIQDMIRSNLDTTMQG